MVARQTNHTLHQELRWIHRKIEDYDISSFDRAIRQQRSCIGSSREMNFIHQEKVPYQQRIFHGSGRNLEGLYDKRDHEDAEDHYREKRLGSKEIAWFCSVMPSVCYRLNRARHVRDLWRLLHG